MRSIRRTFAAPLVLVAPLAACESQSHTSNPPPPPPPEHTHNPPAPVNDPPPQPPAPTPDPKPPEHTMNPPPPTPAPIPEVHPKDLHWTIAKKDGKCTAFFDDACKDPNRKPGDPIPPCNPPVPTDYPCQPGQADDFKIVKHDGAAKCFVAQFQCPANAKCKPLPPPTEVPCPK